MFNHSYLTDGSYAVPDVRVGSSQALLLFLLLREVPLPGGGLALAPVEGNLEEALVGPQQQRRKIRHVVQLLAGVGEVAQSNLAPSPFQ